MATVRDLTAEELAAYRAAARRSEGTATVIAPYAVVAGRIRQEMAEIERVVERGERAVKAAGEGGIHRELFLDSAELSLHNFCSGIERLEQLIASTVDRAVPSTHDRGRERPRHMAVPVTGLRLPVLSQAAADLDEYRRFRYVLRNVRAVEHDPAQIERFTANLRPVFTQVRAELEAFADVLLALSNEA
jgi:hypothetical protein